MRLHTNKLSNIVSEFLLSRVVAKAPTSATQFGVGFLVPYVANSVGSMVESNRPMLTSLGIVDDRSSIDLDTARSSAMSALEKSGGKVEMLGLVFDRSDIDALYEIAQRFAE